jgi:hypothetical protein
MNDLKLRKSKHGEQIFEFASIQEDPSHCSWQASAPEYSCQVEGQELAEALASLPDSYLRFNTPLVEADDFERLYHWFLA